MLRREDVQTDKKSSEASADSPWTDAKKMAYEIKSHEDGARRTESQVDLAANITAIQNEVAVCNQKGYDFAISVLNELRSNDLRTQELPFIELTDGRLNLRDSKSLQKQVQVETTSKQAVYDRNNARLLRESLGLPNDARDLDVQAALMGLNGKSR
jgi:hypothetical protein